MWLCASESRCNTVKITLHYPAYYRNFSCIGGQCEATCCAGWEISIDRPSMKTYRRARGAFGKKLKAAINTKEMRFNTEAGHCPMLNGRGLCEIYRVLGVEKMCRTCRIYPRHMEDYGRLREIMLSLSCPEAARIILGNKESFSIFSRRCFRKLALKQADTGISEARLKRLLGLRGKLFYILGQKQMPLSQRLEETLKVVAGQNRPHRLEALRGGPAYAPGLFEKGGQGERIAKAACGPEIDAYMDMLLALEPVTRTWRPFLTESIALLKSEKNLREHWDSFRREVRENAKMYENLAAHYLYMYFAGAVYDKEEYKWSALIKTKLMIFHVLILYRLHYAQWLRGNGGLGGLVSAVWIYSRQMDHSDTNLEALEELLGRHPLFSVSCLTKQLGEIL